jgi:hypothetical protein
MALNIYYIISEKYLKENTVIENSVDDKLLRSSIKDAQQEELIPIIGSSLFDSLVDKMSGGTLSGQYKVLVDNYIIPMLEKYSVLNVEAQITQKGVVQKDSDNSTHLSQSSFSYKHKLFENKAIRTKSNLMSFLKKNYSDFTELTTSDWYTENVSPSLDIESELDMMYSVSNKSNRNSRTYRKPFDPRTDGWCCD